MPYIEITYAMLVAALIAFINPKSVRELKMMRTVTVLALLFGVLSSLVELTITGGAAAPVLLESLFRYALWFLAWLLARAVIIVLVWVLPEHRQKKTCETRIACPRKLVTAKEYLALYDADGCSDFNLPPLWYAYILHCHPDFRQDWGDHSFFGILEDGYGLLFTRRERIRLLKAIEKKCIKDYVDYEVEQYVKFKKEGYSQKKDLWAELARRQTEHC